jgi:hypothetical protein
MGRSNISQVTMKRCDNYEESVGLVVWGLLDM